MNNAVLLVREPADRNDRSDNFRLILEALAVLRLGEHLRCEELVLLAAQLARPLEEMRQIVQRPVRPCCRVPVPR